MSRKRTSALHRHHRLLRRQRLRRSRRHARRAQPKRPHTCAATGKRFYSEQEASDLAPLLTLFYGGRMNAYPCPDCGHWHVGHAPAWRLMQEEEQDA